MRRTLVILILVGIAMVAVATYFLFDPSTAGFFPRCPFLTATGLKCPGCGSQRAIHALLHGQLGEAFRYNALLPLSIPLLALCVFAESVRTSHPALYVRLQNGVFAYVFVGLVMLWWVVRNLFGW